MVEPSRLTRALARTAGVSDDRLVAVIGQLVAALERRHACIELPEDPELDALLAASGAVGSGDGLSPLVRHGNRLYFHRYFEYERDVARRLRERNRLVPTDVGVVQSLQKYFPDADERLDWQHIAALQALCRRLALIVGGPGTGKTSTVVRILAAVLESRRDLHIRLAAPTGKAAMRLTESITGQLDQLPEEIRGLIPTDVQTLHRLLGYMPAQDDFRHGEHNPIPCDLLVVDEVSMVDLPMMHRILCATTVETRLIFLGDPEQLPSVDTGNVLGDICRIWPGYDASFSSFVLNQTGHNLRVTEQPHGLKNAVCRLQDSYRFNAEEGIGRLARRIGAGDTLLTEDDRVRRAEVNADCLPVLRSRLDGYLDTVANHAADPITCLAAFDAFRILCPTRDGDYGVNAINRDIEDQLATEGRRDPDATFYHGRPVMITRNDYNLGLFNGDIGICLGQGDEMRVVFPDASGTPRRYLTTRLPAHETCFAMTVHKSQGSEYEEVALVLAPPATESAASLYTRELLYTAITRARERLWIACDDTTWATAVGRQTDRASGLADWLTEQ